jgi:hypothetical protein
MDDGPWSSAAAPPRLAVRALWVAALGVFLGVNYASAAGYLGATNAELSARHLTPATPAGYAFAIWGVIFLLETAGTVYVLHSASYDADGHKARYANAVARAWPASWLAAAAWQAAFARDSPRAMWLAAALIAASCAAMAAGLRNLYATRARHGGSPAALDYALLFLPTSINAAWLLAATSVQLLVTAAPLVSAGVLEAAAAVAVVAVAAAGLLALLRFQDAVFALTIVWALLAIYKATPSAAVRLAVAAGVGALAIGGVAAVLRRRGGGGEAAEEEEREPLRA